MALLAKNGGRMLPDLDNSQFSLESTCGYILGHLAPVVSGILTIEMRYGRVRFAPIVTSDFYVCFFIYFYIFTYEYLCSLSQSSYVGWEEGNILKKLLSSFLYQNHYTQPCQSIYDSG